MLITRITHNAKPVGQLDWRVCQSLASWWRGTAGHEANEAVVSLIKDLHRANHWIACGCRNELVDPMNSPILAPGLVDGTGYLRRLSKRAMHHEECLFWFEQKEQKDIPSDGGGISEMGDPPSFTAGAETISRTSVKRGGQDNAKPAHTTSPATTIARRLFWLAAAAGLQRAPKIKSPVASLLTTAQALSVAPGLTLKDILYCRPEVWGLGWAQSAFTRCENAKIAPMCWWVQPALSIDTDSRRIEFESAGETIRVQVKREIGVFGGDLSPSRFPMLVMCMIKKNSEDGVHIHSAYAHPIASEDRWMLLDSDHERQTLGDLITVCEWLRAEKGIELQIDKPLHAWLNTAERPDFVLTRRVQGGKNLHLIIETMGYDDESYEARKAELSKNVRWPVYLDRRATLEKSVGRDLKSAVARWALQPAN